MKQQAFLSTIVLTFLQACSTQASPKPSDEVPYRPGGESTKEYQIILEYLQEPLWQARNAYDAGHRLMIPLHWAFLCEEEPLVEAFEGHFRRMLAAWNAGHVDLGTIQEFQYLSLVSRYLALQEGIVNSPFHMELVELVRDRFQVHWAEEPAWHWSHNNFNGGVSEKVKWKLSNPSVEKSFHTVIHDQEFYLMGIAADILDTEAVSCPDCKEAVGEFLKIMKERLDQEASGWSFQEGMWSEHHTYAYAGYLTAPPDGAGAKRVRSIQEDTSHAHRWPLWLEQLGQVTEVRELRQRLSDQLTEVVIDWKQIEAIGVPVLRNYLSGHNGYYRWNYSTHRPRSGYGPYELSGTFGLGWWSFLGGNSIQKLYRQLAEAYPLDSAQKALYDGLSTRTLHSIVQNEHDNGLREQIARMAADVAYSYGEGGSLCSADK